jgi:excisionase family DNA binding protein
VNITEFRATVDALVRDAPADTLPAAIGELARGQAELEARNRQLERTTTRRQPVREVDEHYTAEEVAKLLNVKKSWVYEHRGELGGIKLSGGCVRYPAAKIVRRLQSVSWQG